MNINFNYQFPYLYRYENDEYINLFFETGKILISSFHSYKSYSDNQLGDTEEGKSEDFIQTTNDPLVKAYVRGYSEAGNNHYCFCTSTLLNSKLYNVFSRNSVFRIIDMTGFAIEVCKLLKGATGELLFGNCDYLTERIVRQRVGSLSVQFQPTDTNIESVDIHSMSLFDNKLLFIKRMKYQSQGEYRILWPTIHEVHSSIVLDCPGAIRYCEKISKDEIEEISRKSIDL